MQNITFLKNRKLAFFKNSKIDKIQDFKKIKNIKKS